ncbi:MAG: hypothetical protein IPP69_14650 [Flavobacteriales bacterium]|nr:hypothetical protein [Flavobacteriales bacterium]
MKLSQFIINLQTIEQMSFILPDGQTIPAHFHITEAGLSTKHFIDCGGTIRMEKAINLQLWVAGDLDHRLTSSKMKKIMDLASPLFGQEDLEIEVEYQTSTVGRYGLDFDGKNFMLTTKETDCLAKDHCGIPTDKLKVNLSELGK